MEPTRARPKSPDARPQPRKLSGRLHVNGAVHQVALDPRSTVLDVLRDQLGLTGTKQGCDHGQCGTCTILANGQRVLACLALAVEYQDAELTTIEGLAPASGLHPVQAAFLACRAFQCGYCTPGQILSAVALLEEARHRVPSAATTDVAAPPALDELSDAELRERMSGNLCRCAAYPSIIDALRAARAPRSGGGGGRA